MLSKDFPLEKTWYESLNYQDMKILLKIFLKAIDQVNQSDKHCTDMQVLNYLHSENLSVPKIQSQLTFVIVDLVIVEFLDIVDQK